MNKNISQNIVMLSSISIYILTPLFFAMNPIVLVVFLLVQLLCQAQLTSKVSDTFIVLLLNGFLYSGISIGGLRLYDWIILGYFVWIILFRYAYIKVWPRLIFFSLCVILVFAIHGMEMQGFVEVIRYLISVFLVILVTNLKPSISAITKPLISVCIINIYNAILIYILIKQGVARNYEGAIISTDIFFFSGETRLNGFFSDPNKYMTFSLALIFIVYIFLKDSKQKKIVMFLLIVATIISLSRTALFCVALYIAFEFGLFIKRKNAKIYYSCIAVVLLLMIGVFALPDTISTTINTIYTVAARILGREHTLEINATLHDDNRMIIWRMAIECILRKPLLGYGWLSFSRLLPYPTHNTVLSLLLDGGIFVFLAYLYTIFPLLSNRNYNVLIPCVIIPSLVLDLGNYRIYFLLLALIVNRRGIRRNA